VNIEVRRLPPTDDRTRFRSGNLELDRFFANYAGQNQFKHHVGSTYVAADESGTVFGFATVSASELLAASLTPRERKGLPLYPLPVLRLARLAVDERAQGLGIGRLLLRSVFVLAREMADSVGCTGVVVDAKPQAVSYYRNFGFLALEIDAGELGDRPQPLAMFLKLGTIPRAAG
jgi:GNAT superfamily N-acetyltransferase